MPGLGRAWRTICRFIARTDITAATDAGNDRTGNVHLHHGTLVNLRAGGRWLFRFCTRLTEGMQETQRHSDLMRRAAIWNERRATRRALILLLKQLNPEQRQEFREYKYFHVTGGSSGDRYRIRVGTIANIDVLRHDGMVRHRLCGRPADDIPVYDVMAAQLLHLQDPEAERRFLQQANIQSTRPEDYGCFRSTLIA